MQTQMGCKKPGQNAFGAKNEMLRIGASREKPTESRRGVLERFDAASGRWEAIDPLRGEGSVPPFFLL